MHLDTDTFSSRPLGCMYRYVHIYSTWIVICVDELETLDTSWSFFLYFLLSSILSFFLWMQRALCQGCRFSFPQLHRGRFEYVLIFLSTAKPDWRAQNSVKTTRDYLKAMVNRRHHAAGTFLEVKVVSIEVLLRQVPTIKGRLDWTLFASLNEDLRRWDAWKVCKRKANQTICIYW